MKNINVYFDTIYKCVTAAQSSFDKIRKYNKKPHTKCNLIKVYKQNKCSIQVYVVGV